MTSTPQMLKPVVLAALMAVVGAAQAELTTYSTQASFLAAVSNPGVDGFNGLSITTSTPSPLTRSAGPYSYTATVTTTSFFGAGTTANPWLSTNTATDSITFSGFTGGVSAIGGLFFASNISGLFAAGDVTLTATDSLGATLTQTITGATTSSFLGFTSTGTITSLVLSSVQPATGFVWPTTDNLTLAVAVVPEVQTYALMLAGLGALGLVARRRRSR
jgi:hypothetical protein